MNPKRTKKPVWLDRCVNDVCHITKTVHGKNWENITHADLYSVLSKLSTLVERAWNNAPQYRTNAVLEEARKIHRAADTIIDIKDGFTKGNIDDCLAEMRLSAETLRNFIPSFA